VNKIDFEVIPGEVLTSAMKHYREVKEAFSTPRGNMSLGHILPPRADP
jgi:hypothetical protein